MSKNSSIQNYEAVKAYIQVVEHKRKREGRKPKQKFRPYHPSLEYNEE